MSQVQMAAFFAWLTVVLWDAISLAFFWDCLRVNRRTRLEYRLARARGNGRVIVARYRHGISKWYVLGSGIALAAGLLSAYSNAFLPHPPPDTRIVGSVVRLALITMIFAFWKTKRGNIALYREVDAKYRKEVQKAREQTQDERETRDAP